jgi:photosystem II stability/assembly factor-like uncharacterized protein
MVAVLAAAEPEPIVAGDNEWTTHGPEGGWVQLLAVDPQNPEVMYISAGFGAGLLKTSDGGSHWTGLQAPSETVSALVIDPQTPNILYAIAGYGLLFKSIDGGASWSQSQLPIPGNSNRSTFNAVAIDPKNPSTLYGAWSSGGLGTGVLKSSDGGASWNEVNSGLIDEAHPHAAIGALAVDPQTHTIYASAVPRGIFTSSDAGMSWRPVLGGDWLPYTIGSFVVDPRNAGTVYALAGSGGVLKSTDSGETWITLPLPKTGNGRDFWVNATAVTLDPENPDTVYCALTMQQLTSSGAAISSAVIASPDGGFTWTDISQGFSGGVPEIQRLAVAPPDQSPARRREPRGSPAVAALHASSLYGGMFKTVDGGMHWIPENSGIMAAEIFALAMDPQNPNTIYASSFGGGVYKSIDMGGSWAVSGWPGRFVFGLAVDPRNSNTIYAADCNAVYRSADGGAHWTLLDTSGCSVVIDPQNPGTVYTELGKSTDDGATWAKFNWPSHVYVCCSTSPLSVAIDPQHPGTIYVGAIDGRVLKSMDGGTNWSVISSAWAPSSDPSWMYFVSLTIDPRYTNTVYASVIGDYSDQLSCVGVFKTTDGGTTWAEWGLPQTCLLAMDPQTPTTLYAFADDYPGNHRGGFKSTDGGETFVSFPLPSHAGINSPMVIDPRNPNRLYVGSVGVYAIDITSPEN